MILIQRLLRMLSTVEAVPMMKMPTALAALAGLACGMWSSLEELETLRRSDRVFLPQRVQSECDEEYRLWKRAVARAADWIEH